MINNISRRYFCLYQYTTGQFKLYISGQPVNLRIENKLGAGYADTFSEAFNEDESFSAELMAVLT